MPFIDQVVSQRKKQNLSLQHTLRITHNIQDIKQSKLALTDTIESVIEAYGGPEKVLECLVKHSNLQQLESIDEVVKEHKLEYDAQNNNENNQHDHGDAKPIIHYFSVCFIN